MKRHIFVAIDGSVFSSNSLDYLIKLFHNKTNLHVHLFSVVPPSGNDQSWMYDVDPLRTMSTETDKRTGVANRYLEDAKVRLVRNGFDEAYISCASCSASSIATAIQHEANRGNHDALLIGRRGMGMVGEMFFGSTSGQLIEKCHQIPLWIIDGEITSNRFLLAVHSTPDSLMAADHLAYMLKHQPDCNIMLYHSKSLFSGKPTPPPEDFHPQWGKEWCDAYLDIENYLFFAHAQVLMDGGIDRRRITQLPMQTHIDAGSDLLRQAKKHHCGTIVLGRDGRGPTKGLLGGVSDRTVNLAHDLAVWLVG